MISHAAYVARATARKQAFLTQWKAGHGCLDCGERDPVVLEFAHLDRGQKHERLRRKRGRMAWQKLSWPDLLVELLHVAVLCANCHRRETREES